MEWYMGAGVDDFVVPKDQELLDRFPSPESWTRLCTSALEESELAYRRFEIDPKWDELELNRNEEVEMEYLAIMEDQPNGQFADESLHRSFLSCDQAGNQLDDELAGIRQMDEFFLSSLPEDLPGSYLKSFFFPSGTQSSMPVEYLLDDMVLDSQSTSSNTQSTGISKHCKTYAITPSFGRENGGVNAASQIISGNTNQGHWPERKDLQEKISVLGQHGYTDRVFEEETSIEETVLQELEIVLTQLTNKTRICFRDALYRLAKNSGQHVENNKDEDIVMVTPEWSVEDGKSRMEGNEVEESKTNVVDRAIASIMFNKMDLNMLEFSVCTSPNSEQEIEIATKPPTYSLSPPECDGILGYPAFCGDVEVPIPNIYKAILR